MPGGRIVFEHSHRNRYGVLVVDVLELLELDPPESGEPPGRTVVLSVCVSVFVDGPGTGTTVVLCVDGPGTTVVVCVLVAGGFSTVASQPARPITAIAKRAAIPNSRVFMFFLVLYGLPSERRVVIFAIIT